MKLAIYGGATLGGLIGGYVPVLLFHASALGMSSLVWGSVGTLVGLIAGIKAGKYLGL
ncbi:MAG TPA: hypothetical protein VLF60_02660 [Candidatus Saccharimonadales bacterium]|nr:hypothetical protein [Candidatus Saccharimonadales bacterium]